MSIFNNKEHFLHEHLTFLETTDIEGKDSGFNKFLSSLGISNQGNYWDVDHSNLDWDQIQNHHQFDFNSVSVPELSEWLQHSAIAEHEFLFTWLDWEDPIIKIKTTDFIRKWEYFYNAAIDGMVLTAIDGVFFMEFTDDWKSHLNSNFIIKPL